MTRDQKVSGSNHVWVAVVWKIQSCLTGLTKAWRCVALYVVVFEYVKKSRGFCRLRVSVCRRYVHNSDEKDT